MYHGTGESFQTFNPARVGTSELGQGPGIYFTDSPSYASEAAFGAHREGLFDEMPGAKTEGEARAMAEAEAERTGRIVQKVSQIENGEWVALLHSPESSPNIHPAYLNIERWFDFDAPLSKAAAGRITKAVKALKPDSTFVAQGGAKGEKIHSAVRQEVGVNRVNEVMESAGFDGLKLRELEYTSQAEATTYVVFKPEQIHAAYKSSFLSENIVTPSLAHKLLSYSLEEPAGFTGWLLDKTAAGSGLGRLGDYVQAEKLAQRTTASARSRRWTQSDPRGHRIDLRRQTWEEHIEPRHTEEAANEDLIRQALADPDSIRTGDKPDVEMYWKTDTESKRLLRVPVKWVREGDTREGVVLTSFFSTGKPKSGEVLWKRGESAAAEIVGPLEASALLVPPRRSIASRPRVRSAS